jgi:uncharacterized delta-60 repeat protein
MLPWLAPKGARASASPAKAGVMSVFHRVFIAALGAVALLLLSVAQAETWTFDPTFQRTPLRVTSESAYGVKILISGKVLIFTINGTLMSGANGQRIGPLVRVDPNSGAIDPTWSPDPTLIGSGLYSLAEAPDGKIYYSGALTGDFVSSNPNDPAVNRLIRLNLDGTRDTSFNSPIFAAAARFITVQPDGKIIACFGGAVLTGVPPPGSITHTVRLNTDGTLDTSFQSPNFQNTASSPPESEVGVFGNPVIDSVTGKIYFCGTFSFVNGQPRKAIARCNADGTLDSGFAPTELIGGNTSLIARAMVLQTSGKVVVAGNRLQTAAGGGTHYAFLRFNDDGTLDPAFTLLPTTTSSGVPLVPGYVGPRDIHTLPSGNILANGSRVLRFLQDGALDSAFTPLDYSSPFSPNRFVESFRFAVDENTGVAYLANPYPLYARLGGVPVPGNITKLTPAGAIDPTFNSPVVESEDFAPDVQIAPNGAVYVSGYHTDFGSTANATITRLLANGTRDAAYSLGMLPFADKQAAGFAPLPDSSAYVLYYSGSFNGAYQFSNLVRLLPTGALDTSFHLSSALQTALLINAFDGSDTTKFSLPQISSAPGGKAYLFARSDPQATVNIDGNLKPTRINTDGTEDTSMPALGFPVGEVTRDSSGITGGSTAYLQRLTQTADGGFIVLASVAPFPTLTGAPYNYKVIKLRADGSRDQSFVSPSLTSTALPSSSFPPLFDPVTGMTIQPVNGFYTAPPGFPVSSAAMFPDGSVLLAGNFRLTGGSTDFSLAKLTATGSFDNSFTPPVPQNLARPTRPALITNVRLAPDGRVWVLGRFDTIGGLSAPGVARMNPNGALENSFNLTQVGYYDSFGDLADVVFANSQIAYLVGTFRRPTGDPLPFAITRIATVPVITSPLNAAGTVGVPFTYQFLTSGATSLGVSGLPPGLVFNANLAAIIGTPTASGVTPVVLSASNGAGATMATLNITIQPPPSSGPTITSSSAATGRPGQFFRFQVTTTGGSPAARLSATGLPPGLDFDAVTGVISGIPAFEGSTAVTLTVTDGAFTTSAVLQLTFTADPALPVITSPNSAALIPGVFFSYAITAPTSVGGSDPTIFTLVGTLPPGLTFDAATGTISGIYTGPLRPDLAGGTLLGSIQLFATNSHGTSTFDLLLRAPPKGVVNIATRTTVGAGDNALIGGFIVDGDVPKIVIIRAIGPSLNAFLSGALQDPTLELHDSAHPDRVIFNDNWRDTQEQIILGSGLQPTDNGEPAIVAALDPGSYTAIVRGTNATTGIAVVQVYDLGTASAIGNSGNARVSNIATRGFVNTDDNVMIGGVIIQGQPTRVIIRAIGPALAPFGVPDALANPQLELHDATSTIARNDDWQTTQIGGIITSDQVTEIQTSQLAPTNSREAAIIVTLPPGSYTAIVRGTSNTTGNALVEVYALE